MRIRIQGWKFAVLHPDPRLDFFQKLIFFHVKSVVKTLDPEQNAHQEQRTLKMRIRIRKPAVNPRSFVDLYPERVGSFCRIKIRHFGRRNGKIKFESTVNKS